MCFCGKTEEGERKLTQEDDLGPEIGSTFWNREVSKMEKKEDAKESPIPMLVLLVTIVLGMVGLILFVFLGK